MAGNWNSGSRRRVRMVEFNITYNSVTECAKAIGGSRTAVQACLNGTRKTHKGYHFEYVKEN